MATFVQGVVIDAPVERVFRFHEREDALALLSPSFPPVTVVSKSGGIEAGGRVELRVLGVIRWVALHTVYEKDRLFVDEQIEGPFARWVHRHEFEDLAGRTRLVDRVSYELRGGAFLNTLAQTPASLALRQMFTHRHRVTTAWCESRESRQSDAD